MINLLGLIALLLPLICFGSNNVPGRNSKKNEFASRILAIYKNKNLTFLGSLIQEERVLRNFRRYGMTARYRVHPSIKVGAGYIREYGNRHDGDWINETGSWKWRDTDDRGEDLFIAQGLFRELIPFFKDLDLLGEVRVQFELNDFNQQQTLKIRPGLTYFYFDGLAPLFDLTVRYENYYALNFSKQSVYQKWFYFSPRYHFNRRWKIGISYAYVERRWSSTASIEAITSNPFIRNEYSNQYALNVFFQM